MTTVDQAVAIPARSRSEQIVRFVSRTPIHFALIGLAIIWLVPTVGLAITSFATRCG